MKVFAELSDYNRYLNLDGPSHPMMDSRVCKQAIPNFPASSDEIQVNLYKIAFKKDFHGEIKYGKGKYKTDNGLMLFSEPGQVVSWESLTFWDGYAFVFHPDLIKEHAIARQISRYKYFSYEIDDALFLTSEEEETITWLFTRIHTELHKYHHQASDEIILSLLQVILTYAERYYERQFREQLETPKTAALKVRRLLQEHYQNLSLPVGQVPTVSALAARLHLSPNYLTDLVRQETGKSTISLIHEFVVEQAEILLLQTDLNVGDVAYRLGFESVPYFSRLFKKSKGVSPLAIRNQGKG